MSRARRVRRAASTSDVARFRGVFLAAGCAAAVSAGALLSTGGQALRGAPGPLSPPHREAALSCESCHGGGDVSAACAGCHGPHPSARAPHRRLASAGVLACRDCHGGHGEGGALFPPGGAPLRYGAGGEEPAGPALYRPSAAAAVAVPLVEIRVCSRCHDPTDARDAIADCLLPGQASLGSDRPTVCFDEHRSGRDAGAAGRSAAWDAAREVAADAPLAPSAPGRGALVWLCLVAGAVAAAMTWAIRRWVERRRRAGRAGLPGVAAGASPADGAPLGEAGLAPGRAAVMIRPPDVVRLPVVNAATCLGCHACVDACPYDVLEVRRYIAVVARPSDCCGLTLCEQKCPNGSLVMVEQTSGEAAAVAAVEAVEAGPGLLDTLESRDVPGLFLAGDVTGLSLIRNAVNQGAHAVRAIAAAGERADHGELDLLIVGAGPAGLSAALEAQALGLRYLALEQGSVADSIRSFPRGKLILDPDLPLLGRLWLAETSKEELLAEWLRIARRAQPAIREGQRVTAIDRDAVGFRVTSMAADGTAGVHRARHLLLAMGRRGTPRRLSIDVPPPWTDRVHYSLADARSFAGRRVLVVGLGDVAMEAAVALSRQPGTEVAVSYRGPDFQRGKARNIAEVRRREAAGALRMLWRTELRGLAEPDRALLATPDGVVEFRCDALLCFIGSLPPTHLLEQAGVRSRETGRPAEPLKADDLAARADRPEEARRT